MNMDSPAIRSRSTRAGTVLVVAALTLGLISGAPPPEASADEAPVFPRTFESIWYRSGGHGGFGGGRLKGDLTLTRDGLLFASPKREIVVPYESIHMIGLGKMRGDVNTDWVVLAVDHGGRRDRVGFRDGNRWGYGGKTPVVHEAIRASLESLGHAQFGAPPGYRAYTELDAQFTFPVPESWVVHHLELVDVGGWPRWGALVIRPPHDPEPAAIDTELELRRLREGGEGAWIVERRAAGDGMDCGGFSQAGIRQLRDTIAASAYFGAGVSPESLGEGEPVVLDECRGLKFTLSAGDGAGAREIWGASAGDTLFLFGVGVPSERADDALARFRAAMGDVRFSPVRSPAG